MVLGESAATFSRFFKRKPHALHSVEGPEGPPLRTGVSEVPHSSQSHRGCAGGTARVVVLDAEEDGGSEDCLSFAAVDLDDDGLLLVVEEDGGGMMVL